MRKIQNKGLRYFLIFIIISLVNDAWSLTLGPLTLNHIFILMLIYNFKIIKPEILDFQLWKIQSFIIFYILVLVTNSVLTLELYSQDFGFIAIVIKLSIIIIISPYLTVIRKEDLKYFYKYLFYALFLLVLLPGVIEFVTKKNVLSYSGGTSQDSFYLRAFTIDKVDFGFNLIMLMAVSIIQLRNTYLKKKIGYLIIVLLVLFFLVFSFSLTNVLGVIISGLLYILFYSKYKIKHIFIAATLITFSFVATEEIHEEYELKYNRQSTQIDSAEEFRTLAFFESIDIFLESPFIGHGSEANGYLLRERINWLNKTISSHNIISEFTNYGLLGAIPILSVFIYISIKFVKFKKLGTDLGLFFIMISGPLLTRLIFYFHRFDRSIYLIWILVGIMFIYQKTNAKKIQNRSHR